MPDLEQSAVTAWLTALRPDPAAPAWPPAIRPIETQEDLPDRLTALGAAFDAAAQGGPQPVAAALRNAPLRDDMAAFLACCGCCTGCPRQTCRTATRSSPASCKATAAPRSRCAPLWPR